MALKLTNNTARTFRTTIITQVLALKTESVGHQQRSSDPDDRGFKEVSSGITLTQV